MKFFCEYCGNVIDSNEDDKCPNCGASYKKNKSFIKLKEEQNKNQEMKQQIIHSTLGVMKFSKWLVFMPMLTFILIFFVAMFCFSKILNDESNKIKNGLDSTLNQAEKITVNLNEFGETTNYKVKVEKYEVMEDTFNKLDEGYEYVKFYLIVENLTAGELKKEDVYCIVDGISQTNKISSGYSDLPMFISKDLTVKGTAIFEVPKDTTSYDIKYGDM